MYYFYKLSYTIIIAIIISSCAATPQLTYSNYIRVEKGMTEQDVINILGEPDKVTDGSFDAGKIGSLFGLDDLSATTMTWLQDDIKANILFFKGKVKTRSFTNQF
ncbi:MAG: hypothetical protein KAH84_04275 [Thiomargarita sp.]|nr:hypothetical protein [Thiomargarita sp.]